ncbi:MAG: hypothetical protein QM784_34735 [Polyangiaceae bacterium]
MKGSKLWLGSALPLGLALLVSCPRSAMSAGTEASARIPSQSTTSGAAATSNPAIPSASSARIGEPSPDNGKPNSAANGSSEPERRNLPFAAPEDRVEVASDLPANSLEVTVVDANERLVADVHLELVRERQSIAEGNESSSRSAVSDRNGLVRFDNLDSNSETRYRIVAHRNAVRYGMPSFSVSKNAGLRAKFHVYEVTSNIREALVAARTFLFIEPRDEVLQVEVMSELHNLGALVWAPSVELKLPEGWKAFSTNEGDPDVRIEKTTNGVRLVGAVTPGQHALGYSFQVPTGNHSSVEWLQPLWPHTAETRIATVVRSGLELEVEGYPAAELVQGNNQRPMLMTGRSYGGDAKAPEEDLRVSIHGLPVVGKGRWVAAIIAGVLVVAAFTMAWLKARAKVAAGRDGRQGPFSGQLEREAHERLLDELARLTAARKAGQIGEQTFVDAQDALVSACVRLERQMATTEK